MRRNRKRWRTYAGGLSGLAFGALGGIAAVALLAGGASGKARGTGDSFITAGHVPPLLTIPGERPTLRYAIVCPPPGVDPASGDSCDGAGDVYIRPGRSGSFERLPLVRGSDSAAGRYFADVPADSAFSSDGFSYYAVLRDQANGTMLTVPAGGADAPQQSYPLRAPVRVELAAHVFGSARRPDARVLDAPWGTGTGEAGLSGGNASIRIGPSSFDVMADGTVALLDEVNGRIQRWRAGALVDAVRVDVPAATNDMGVGADGSIYVLDGRGSAGSTPLIRTFAADGTLIRARHIAERTWSQMRIGPRGAIVHQEPSDQWMPVTDGAASLDRSAQVRAGTAGLPFPDGSHVIVLRSGGAEVRVARIVNGSVRASWRVVSATPLGEVQLAQPTGNRVVLVVKAYTDTQDEFQVLVLDGRGLRRQFSVASDQWADAAPLAHFRLAGSSLYKLGSSPAGAFVDRYDLGSGR
jgi:hypothetical protein